MNNADRLLANCEQSFLTSLVGKKKTIPLFVNYLLTTIREVDVLYFFSALKSIAEFKRNMNTAEGLT